MSSFQVKIVDDFCNLRCVYCRNRDFDQDANVVMSMETLEQFFKVTSALPQTTIRVSWHGGEPLLAGKDFFRRIVRLEG
ncbi:MAG: anaerobic sulfatase maturase, partial [Candidatus Binatia bacterium]|nr:anaerobic sulfatase maturase [Candidatus Binatia bacterium]